MSSLGILINVGAQTASAVTELNKVNTALDKQMTKGEKFSKAMSTASIGATAALGGLAAAGLSSVKSAEEAAIANDKLAQVYKQMGYEKNAKAAQEYADALESQIGVDADIIKGAQTKLATFSDVAKSSKLMERATKTAADLAAAGFGDIGTQSIGLGKALQDPIKGMSLLTKAGSLTKKEQKAIADEFKKTGDKAKAQESILKALEKQVGGVAEAGAKTGDKLTIAFGNIGETIGTMLLPYADKFAAWMQKAAKFAEDNSKVLLILAGVIATVAGAVIAINAAFKVYRAISLAITAVNAIMGASWVAALGPIGLIIAAIAAVIAIGVLLYKNWDKISAWLKQTWESIKTKTVEAWEAVKSAVSTAITNVVEFVKGLPGKALEALGNLTETLKQKGKDLLDGLWNGVKAVWELIKAWYIDLPIKILRAIGAVGSTLFNKGKDFLDGLWDGVKNVWTSVKEWFDDLPGKVLRAIGAVGSTLYSKGTSLLDGLWDGIKGVWSSVKEWFDDLPGKISRTIGSLGSTLYNKGRDLIEGFVDGIKSMGNAILNAILSLLPNSIEKVVRKAIGFSAPVGSGAVAASAYSLSGSSSSRQVGGYGTTIIINGAIDPESTARQIRSILTGQDLRQGRAPGQALARAW